MNRKGWERLGKRALTRAAAGCLRARGEAGPPPDLADLERILLVRQQNQLGDLLLSTPALRAVRRRAPRARIDFVAGPQNVEAVEGSRRLDEVLVYDKKAWRRRPHAAKRFLDRLRDARYDLVLVMSTVSFSHTSAWLAALSGARRRAGRPGPGGRGGRVARDLYHWVLPPPVAGRHQSAVSLDLVRPFGARGEDGRPEIFLRPEEERAGAEALASAAGDRTGGALVLLHPGAGKLPNRWPAERFGEVAAALEAEGHRAVLCAGPAEGELLAAAERGAGRRLARLPGLGFRDLAGAFRRADLLVANDTGVLHLGAATGVAVLALFGPTEPREWCPAAPRVRFVRAPGGRLAALPVEAVREAAVGWAARLAGCGAPPEGLEAAPVLAR